MYKAEKRSRRPFGRRSSFSASAPGSRRTYKARGALAGSSSRRWPKRVAIGLALLIVLILLGSVGGYIYVDTRLGSIPRVSVPALTPEKSGQPIDILLIGSDSRSCVKTAAGAKAFGSSATQTGKRSDVIIVARFISATHQVEMFSIPRDTWVAIAGTKGSDKINAAFNSGPNQLVETIQNDFHIPINHVMMTNFCGFQSMVDALGGISLNFPDPVRDQLSGLNIKTTGCQLVDGAQALALVRSRHLYYYDKKARSWVYDGMSDWSRIRRQQAFFHALLNGVRGVIPNVFKLNSFLGATVSDLTVDSGLGSGEMISLGLHYRSLGESNLFTTVLPTTSQVISGQDALLPAEPYAAAAIAHFLSFGLSVSGTATTAKAGGGSTPAKTPTTTTPAGVVTDTPQSLPEPWNPVPC
jgi:LCP family protein required for cell wall assembly